MDNKTNRLKTEDEKYNERLQYAIKLHSSLSGYSVSELLELDKQGLLNRDELIDYYCKIKG